MVKWKTIKQNTKYQISNNGKVRSNRTGFILKQNEWKGYKFIKLGASSLRIHRLVAEAFIPNPDCKRCVNHLNLNRSDNRVENLEWVTHKENSEHAKAAGKYGQMIGEKHSQSKLREQDIREIRLLFTDGKTKSHIARKFGVTFMNIHAILTGKTWTHVED